MNDSYIEHFFFSLQMRDNQTHTQKLVENDEGQLESSSVKSERVVQECEEIDLLYEEEDELFLDQEIPETSLLL